MKKLKVVIKVVGVVGLFWFVLPGFQNPSAQTPIPHYETRMIDSKAFRQMHAIRFILESAVGASFISELKAPSSLEELLHSPYMPVLSEKILNPYTGKPIEIVPSLWKEKKEFIEYLGNKVPLPEIPLTHLGNLSSLVFKGEERFVIFFYTEPYEIDSNKRIGLYFPISTKPIKPLEKNVIPGSLMGYAAKRRLFEHYNGEDFFTKMGEPEKRLFSVCWYIRGLMNNAERILKHFPTSFEELKTDALDALYYPGIVNAYTLEPIQDVSYYNPSPGNFTYAYFAATNVVGFSHFPLEAYPICYDSKGSYIREPSIFQVEDVLQGKFEGYTIILH